MIIPAFDVVQATHTRGSYNAACRSDCNAKIIDYIGHCVGSQQRCHVLDIYISDRAFEVSIIAA